MGFCDLTNNDNILILTIHGGDGLREESMEELKLKLEEANKGRRTARGLITTFSGDPFSMASSQLGDKLTKGMAGVVRQLFEMKFPTVAAVTGDIKTSLAMAFVLAHDDASLLDKSKFEVSILRDGHNSLPPYLAALLRDKATYPLMSSKLVLQSEAMDGSMLCGYWCLFECITSDEDEVMKNALSIINRSIITTASKDGFSTTRKSLFPESWKSVSV